MAAALTTVSTLQVSHQRRLVTIFNQSSNFLCNLQFRETCRESSYPSQM